MKKILSFILALAGIFSVASCIQEEEIFTKDGKTPLDTPAITVGEVTSNSMSFYWTAIDNAGQYTYKVLNPAGYVVAKGETKETSVLVKGLKFGTEFSVYVSAVPNGDVAKTLCASESAVQVIRTEDPIVIDYEWVKEGKAWFYYDDDTWNVSNVTVGLEKGTGHFIITSYCGAEGFDFYFDMTKFDGNYPFEFDYSMKNMSPVAGQAIDTQGPIGSRPDFYLAHGLGGKTQDYNVFYGDGGSYEYGVIDPSGGYIDFWTTNFDAQWCGYRVEYGAYEPPAPEPWTPDPDMAYSWSSLAEIYIDGAPTKTYSTVSYNDADASYTLGGWYGVEGYDLVFARNQEDGTWIIDNQNSSAFASDCPGDGLSGYLHGLNGTQSKIVWIKDAANSGLEGTDESGQLWINLLDPDGNEVTYTLKWPAALYTWTKEGSYYSGRHDSTETATLGYDQDNDTYALIVPQYDNAKVLFKTDGSGTFIPVEGGAMNKSDDTWWWIDYGDGDWVYVKIPGCSVDLTNGRVVIDVWNGSSQWTDTFAFIGLPGVDQLVGTYTQASEGWVWTSEWVYEYFTNDVTITKVDDTSIQIVGLINCPDPITAVVNPKIGSLVMAKDQPFQGSYYFKAYGTGEDVTATYDSDLNIDFSVTWSVTNAGGSLYWDNLITTLTKK